MFDQIALKKAIYEIISVYREMPPFTDDMDYFFDSSLPKECVDKCIEQFKLCDSCALELNACGSLFEVEHVVQHCISDDVLRKIGLEHELKELGTYLSEI